MTTVSSDAIRQFAQSCAALGVEVHGRKQIPNISDARWGFGELVVELPDQCDAWRGLIAAGVHEREAFENAYRTRHTYGDLMAAGGVGSGGLDFTYDTGLYLYLPAAGPSGVVLACAAARGRDKDFEQARELIDNAMLADPTHYAKWVLAVLYSRTRRWHDVRQVLGPLVKEAYISDAVVRQAVAVAYGDATAGLGLWDQALEVLADQCRGPLPLANADALLKAGLCARALDKPEQAKAFLNEAYSVPDLDTEMRAVISTALSDEDYGIHPTTAARIDARTDYWDPATEPSDRDLSDQRSAVDRERLKAAAEARLAAMVGMVDVREQIDRLRSSVRAQKRREARGLASQGKSKHLVIKGPPGVGKTTIARVIADLLCADGVLPGNAYVEATRGDLVGDVIGETEKKTRAKVAEVEKQGGGVLFIDEAYLLTDPGSSSKSSKNDFGLTAVGELLTLMVDKADIMMVIVAGYADRMDTFIKSNDGLRRRFDRELDLPSYTVEELVEISVRAAKKSDSVFADLEPLEQLYAQLWQMTLEGSDGHPRRAIDVAGNGGFAAETILKHAEEVRDHRLDVAGRLDDDDASDEELTTITREDAQRAVQIALRMLVKEHPAPPVEEPDDQDAESGDQQ